jgi:hypothetical protein
MILLVSNALKLQDPGVNLTYVKTDNYQMVQRQIYYSLLLMLFVTPEKKYWLYVDKEDLIKQWAYYQNFKDSEPKF